MVEMFEKVDADSTTANLTDIQKYFSETTVFITGGTGFIGKLTIEKLLRECTNLKRIYMLVRSKKGKKEEERFEELFDSIIWDGLKQKYPKFMQKLILVTGDCALPDLGLSSEDRQKLIEEVNCVFHCAATVRFDQPIRTATYINVRATRDMLVLAKEMKNLKSFVYISTAFSHCVRQEIKEEFYKPKISGDHLIALVETLDEELLNDITPHLLGPWPNTYALTKAIAEDQVKTYSHGLPVAIVRPSIVVAAYKEPLAGWIDNIYGATGVLLGAALGVIRTLRCDHDAAADMVPCDYVVNCCIAASWSIGTTKKPLEYTNNLKNEAKIEDSKIDDDPPIYNYVSYTQKKITWRQVSSLAEIHLKQVPSPLLVWHYCLIMTTNYYFYHICLFLLHTVPAHVVDFLARCVGKEPMMVKGYQKINKFLDVLAYFATQQWHFENHNTQALWKTLSERDQKRFNFDMDAHDWDLFFYNFARGGRVYLCKDPMDTLPEGYVKYRKLQVAHYTLCTVLLFLLYKLIMFFWRGIFG